MGGWPGVAMVFVFVLGLTNGEMLYSTMDTPVAPAPGDVVWVGHTDLTFLRALIPGDSDASVTYAGKTTTVDHCQDLYAHNSTCLGFTWHGPDVNGFELMCYTVARNVQSRPLTGASAKVGSFHSGLKTVVALPDHRQLEWMEGEMSQFAHFGLPTFWYNADSLDSFGTYHDCTAMDRYPGPDTSEYPPCLNPELFNPSNLDAEQWVLTAKDAGFQEICLTAHHEGGYALWPSNHTDYSVKKSAAEKWDRRCASRVCRRLQSSWY